MGRLETWLRATLRSQHDDVLDRFQDDNDRATVAAWLEGGDHLPHRLALALADARALQGGVDEAPAWWDDAVKLKDQMSLTELSSHLGVPVTTLTAELRRRGVRRRIKVEAAEVVPTPAEFAGPSRPASKDAQIEQHFHLLGKVPDSEVARLAAVSVRTIASYRSRNNIPGYDGPRRRPPPRGRRESKVDDFADLLGKVPDRVVADIAGMSLGAVRNFRIKSGVEPAGRMKPREIDALVRRYKAGRLDDDALPPEPGERAPAKRAPAAAPPSAKAPAPAPRAKVSSGIRHGSSAWRCTPLSGSAFIVIAVTLHEAIEQAVAFVGDERRIAALENLGPVVTGA